MGSSCGGLCQFNSAENCKALCQRVNFYQVGWTQGHLTVEAIIALTMVLPCLLAAPAKAKPAAAPPPPAAPEPVAAAAPPPAAAPIPTTMPPVPPTSAQPMVSKPGEAAAVFSCFQASLPQGAYVGLKTANSLPFMVKAPPALLSCMLHLESSAVPGTCPAQFKIASTLCGLSKELKWAFYLRAFCDQALTSLFD